MKLPRLAFAALIAFGASTVAAAAADAQPFRHHPHMTRVCKTYYRHGHRTRVCHMR